MIVGMTIRGTDDTDAMDLDIHVTEQGEVWIEIRKPDGTLAKASVKVSASELLAVVDKLLGPQVNATLVAVNGQPAE